MKLALGVPTCDDFYHINFRRCHTEDGSSSKWCWNPSTRWRRRLLTTLLPVHSSTSSATSASSCSTGCRRGWMLAGHAAHEGDSTLMSSCERYQLCQFVICTYTFARANPGLCKRSRLQGRVQDCSLGEQDRRPRAEVGFWGGGSKPLPPARRSGGVLWAPPAGFGAKLWPPKGFPLFSALKVASPDTIILIILDCHAAIGAKTPVPPPNQLFLHCWRFGLIIMETETSTV